MKFSIAGNFKKIAWVWLINIYLFICFTVLWTVAWGSYMLVFVYLVLEYITVSTHKKDWKINSILLIQIYCNNQLSTNGQGKQWKMVQTLGPSTEMWDPEDIFAPSFRKCIKGQQGLGKERANRSLFCDSWRWWKIPEMNSMLFE